MRCADRTTASAGEVGSARPQSAITVMSVALAAKGSTLTLPEPSGANAVNAASA
jgi:hypothetical protein